MRITRLVSFVNGELYEEDCVEENRGDRENKFDEVEGTSFKEWLSESDRVQSRLRE